MSEPVEFKWDKKLIIRDNKNGDKVLETFPEDKLERVKYANFLTKFLADQGYDKDAREKHNYVLNLNSEWGSGKTYFLRRWAEDLKEHYPVVYVDAWKQDYSDDPLMTVISSMIKQLRDQAGSAEDLAVIKASRKLFGLLKAAAPSAARSLTKRYLGIDPVAIMEAEEDNDQLGNAIDENGNPIDMGLAASKVVEHLICEHDAKSAAIESLKMSVEQWVATVIGKDQTQEVDEPKRTYPAFVFIDELDRCRPSYAVEMLETIKHIFDIPGVVFVVATDTKQLQHTICGVYGNGLDAMSYLGRFFHSRFTLKTPSYRSLLPVHCDVDKLAYQRLTSRGLTIWPRVDDEETDLLNITNVYEALELSARQVIQVTERLISTIGNVKDKSGLNIIYLTFLLCTREKHPHLFDELVRKSLTQGANYSDQLIRQFDLSLKWKDFDIHFDLEPNTDIGPLLAGKGKTPAHNTYHKGRYNDAAFGTTLMLYIHIMLSVVLIKVNSIKQMQI